MSTEDWLFIAGGFYLFFGMMFCSSFVAEGSGTREKTMLFFVGLFFWPLPILEWAGKGIVKYVADFVTDK